MALFVGFSLFDDMNSGVSVYSDTISECADSFFSQRDYGAGVRDIVIVWSVYPGAGTKARIRKAVLTIPVQLDASRVRNDIDPDERYDYLAAVTLSQLPHYSTSLIRRGFDANRFLADLTTFLKVEVPKLLQEANIDVSPNYEKL